MKRVSEFIRPEVKWPEIHNDHSPPSSGRVMKCAGLYDYLHSTLRLHSTRTGAQSIVRVGTLPREPKNHLEDQEHNGINKLGCEQGTIQCVPGDLSLEVKQPVREADHSLLSSAKVKACVELYLHSLNRPSYLPLMIQDTDFVTKELNPILWVKAKCPYVQAPQPKDIKGEQR